MADVIPPRGASARTRRERAQLLIVIGVVVAIGLVSLALFLNSIIYAENVGARGADVGGSEAAEFVSTVDTEGQHILQDARAEGEDGEYVVDKEEFNTSIREWNEQARLHYTSHGIYTSVSVHSVDDDGSSANLTVTYESPQISYETTVEIEPGENND